VGLRKNKLEERRKGEERGEVFDVGAHEEGNL